MFLQKVRSISAGGFLSRPVQQCALPLSIIAFSPEAWQEPAIFSRLGYRGIALSEIRGWVPERDAFRTTAREKSVACAIDAGEKSNYTVRL